MSQENQEEGVIRNLENYKSTPHSLPSYYELAFGITELYLHSPAASPAVNNIEPFNTPLQKDECIFFEVTIDGDRSTKERSHCTLIQNENGTFTQTYPMAFILCAPITQNSVLQIRMFRSRDPTLSNYRGRPYCKVDHYLTDFITQFHKKHGKANMNLPTTFQDNQRPGVKPNIRTQTTLQFSWAHPTRSYKTDNKVTCVWKLRKLNQKEYIQARFGVSDQNDLGLNDDDLQKRMAHWEQKTEPFNQATYYVNHKLRKTQLLKPLEPDVDIRRDRLNRLYYINHRTKTTTWDRPTVEFDEVSGRWKKSVIPEDRKIRTKGAKWRPNPNDPDDLPFNWVKTKNAIGLDMYYNHRNGVSQYMSPIADESRFAIPPNPEEIPFPPGVQAVPPPANNPNLPHAFYDAVSDRSEYIDPRGLRNIAAEHRDPADHRSVSFLEKYELFMYYVRTNLSRDTSRLFIKVEEQTLTQHDDAYFTSLFNNLMRLDALQLRGKFQFQYGNELGVDEGGVTRQVLQKFAVEMYRCKAMKCYSLDNDDVDQSVFALPNNDPRKIRWTNLLSKTGVLTFNAEAQGDRVGIEAQFLGLMVGICLVNGITLVGTRFNNHILYACTLRSEPERDNLPMVDLFPPHEEKALQGHPHEGSEKHTPPRKLTGEPTPTLSAEWPLYEYNNPYEVNPERAAVELHPDGLKEYIGRQDFDRYLGELEASYRSNAGYIYDSFQIGLSRVISPTWTRRLGLEDMEKIISNADINIDLIKAKSNLIIKKFRTMPVAGAGEDRIGQVLSGEEREQAFDKEPIKSFWAFWKGLPQQGQKAVLSYWTASSVINDYESLRLVLGFTEGDRALAEHGFIASSTCAKQLVINTPFLVGSCTSDEAKVAEYTRELQVMNVHGQRFTDA